MGTFYGVLLFIQLVTFICTLSYNTDYLISDILLNFILLNIICFLADIFLLMLYLVFIILVKSKIYLSFYDIIFPR